MPPALLSESDNSTQKQGEMKSAATTLVGGGGAERGLLWVELFFKPASIFVIHTHTNVG
jgi:hypothetical protein